MDRIAPFLGGVIGGWFLTEVSKHAHFLGSLNPFLDIVGGLSIVGFSGVLIYKGVKEILNR